jgi:tRNA-specific 2-thiouridylase
MANWAEDEMATARRAADFQDARRVCEELGIPLHKASFARSIRERVFCAIPLGARGGRHTQSRRALQPRGQVRRRPRLRARLGAERFATGHYAASETGALLRGVDRDKDQSLLPARAARGQLAYCDFRSGPPQARGARASRGSAGCRCAKSAIRPASASSASALRRFRRPWLPGRPARSRPRTAA